VATPGVGWIPYPDVREKDARTIDITSDSSDMRIFGITLIVIGILAFALPYFTFTKREKVLDIGPIEAVTESKESIPVSPIVGIVIVAAGAILVASSVVKDRK